MANDTSERRLAAEPALALRAEPASGLDASRFDQAQVLLALADRVERALRQDYELDAAIVEAIFPQEWEKLRIEAGMPSGAPEAVMDAGARDYVRYRRRWWFTSSLDAALTLVPEEADAAGERFRLEAYTSPGVLAPHVRASAWVAGAARVYAASPALALTAAALRARAAILTDKGG